MKQINICAIEIPVEKERGKKLIQQNKCLKTSQIWESKWTSWLRKPTRDAQMKSQKKSTPGLIVVKESQVRDKKKFWKQWEKKATG